MISEAEINNSHYINDQDLKIIQEYIDNSFGDSPVTSKALFNILKEQLTSDITDSLFQQALSCCVRGNFITGIKGFKKVGYKKVEKETPTQRPPSTRKRRNKFNANTFNPDSYTEPKTNSQANPNIETTAHKTPINTASEMPSRPPLAVLPSWGAPTQGKPKASQNGAKSQGNTREIYTPKYTSSWPRLRGNRAYHVWIDDRCFLVAANSTDLTKFAKNVLQAEPSENGNVVIAGEKLLTKYESVLENYITKYHYGEFIGNIAPVTSKPGELPVELKMLEE